MGLLMIGTAIFLSASTSMQGCLARTVSGTAWGSCYAFTLLHTLVCLWTHADCACRQGWLAWAVSGTASYLGYVPGRSQPPPPSFDEAKFQELLQALDQQSAEALSEPILSRPAGSVSLLVRPASGDLCSALHLV